MKRTLFAAWAALSLFTLASCAPDLPSPSGYAVVMGIADYQNVDGLKDLTYTDDDVLSMASLLAEKGYNVTSFIDDTVSEDNPEVTRANLQARISSIASSIGEEETFILYFSGHGGYGPSTAGEEPESRNSYNEFIVLNKVGDPFTYDLLYDDELSDMIAEIKAKKKIVILDSCNSGGFVGSSGSVDAVSQDVYDDETKIYSVFTNGILAKTIGLYFSYPESDADISAGEAFVFSAAGEEEESSETTALGHGVFTYYFLSGAREADDNGDGYITVLELYDYVFRKLQDYYGYSEFSFLPHISGSPMDFVLFD
jgi:hypothetical protein